MENILNNQASILANLPELIFQNNAVCWKWLKVPFLKCINHVGKFGLNSSGFPRPPITKEYSVNCIEKLQLCILRYGTGYDTERYFRVAHFIQHLLNLPRACMQPSETMKNLVL